MVLRLTVDVAQDVGSVSVAEAARLLGIGRARIYQLLSAGLFDAVSDEPLRISLATIERRLQTPVQPVRNWRRFSAWAVAGAGQWRCAFLKHAASLLSERWIAREPALGCVSAVCSDSCRVFVSARWPRGFSCPGQALVELLADARLVLAGASAAKLLGWSCRQETTIASRRLCRRARAGRPGRTLALERDEQAPDVLLRSVAEPWPFPAHARVVPELVAALDLSESTQERCANSARQNSTCWRNASCPSGGRSRRGRARLARWCRVGRSQLRSRAQRAPLLNSSGTIAPKWTPSS